MIVVDSSALIEIVLNAPFADACIEALEEADEVLVSAGTMTESLIVAIGHKAERPLKMLFERFGLNIVPVTEARAHAAADGYRRYGKGRHAASLNFGDSFSYSLAKEQGCPLLFVGNDFAKTDVVSALARTS